MSESTPSQQQHTAAPYKTEYLNIPGVRFLPTDQELIVYFLRPKLHGHDYIYSPTNVVHDADVYAQHPSELVSKLGESLEGNWYVFSPRNRKYANGTRPSRSTGDAGFWKAMGKNEDILDGSDEDEKNQVIGQKRALTYHDFVCDLPGSKPQRKKEDWRQTEWKMLEFVSSNSDKPIAKTQDSMLLNEWVLCKITRKMAQKEKKETTREEKDSGPSHGSGGTGNQFEGHIEPDPVLSPLQLPIDPWLLDNVGNPELDFTGNPELSDEFRSLCSSFGYDGE